MADDRRRGHAWVSQEQRSGAVGRIASRCAICELEIVVRGGFDLERVARAARDAIACVGRGSAPSRVTKGLLEGSMPVVTRD